MLKKYSQLFLFICLLSSFCTNAQIDQYRLEYLTKGQGLSSSEITAIVQDKKGIIWIGTRDGLNRYDGYSVKVYERVPSDSTSLCDNIISTLYIDSRGDLWIGTESNGVSVYNPKHDNFINYLPNREDLHSLSAFHVTSIQEDNRGRIWIGTIMGLNLFQPETRNFKRFMRSIKITLKSTAIADLKSESIPDNFINNISKITDKRIEIEEFIREAGGAGVVPYLKPIMKHSRVEHFGLAIKSLECDDGNTLWISFENQGLGKMNVDDFRVESTEIKASDSKKIFSSEIVSLHWHNKKLWIGTQQGEVNVLDPASNLLKRIYYDPESKFVKCIFSDSHNRVWIGYGKGLLQYNADRDLAEPVKFTSPRKLLSCDVSAIFEDNQGNIWVASYQGGVNIFKRKKAFDQFLFFSEDSPEQVNKSVSSVMEDTEGNIWVGFFTGGIEIIKKDNTRLFLRHSSSNRNSLGLGTVHKIFQDKSQNIWVGTYDGGLQQWNNHTGQFTSYEFDGGPNKIKDVRDIIEDKQGNIWFVVHGDGIKRLNVSNNSITHFRTNYSDSQNSLSNDWVFTIYCDKRNRILAGSVKGFSIYDPATQLFRTYSKYNSNLSHNRVQVIREDQYGQLWLGTQNGLNLFLEDKKMFQVFSSKEGLANNCINGILPDTRTNLWISTNNGLSKLNLKDLKFMNYYDFDGLQSNEFIVGAYTKGKENRLLFGTKSGLTSFKPSEIQENPYKPPVLITNFKLFNQTVSIEQKPAAILHKSITETSNIELSYDQNMLSFEFAAINYIGPERNSYAYKMEGFEKTWNYVGQKREATYTNLKPGNYIFRVKASNNDGIWNEDGVSIAIVINPPIWHTTGAYVLYFITAISLLFFLRRGMIKREKEKSLIKMNEMKLRFFGSLSHEFRTPLTLIIEPLNQLGSYFESGNMEQKELYSLAKRNSDRLLKLTNQLLNICELDGGCMKLKVRENEIVGFIHALVKEFENTAEERGMYLNFISNVPVAYSWFDPDNVEKILFNVLSNAFKYTPDKGSIVVYFTLIEEGHLELVPKQLLKSKHSESIKSRFVKIAVEDSGRGIPTEFKERIFERFFRIDDKEWCKEGTGLGLYLAKQLANAHGGDIIVNSSVGKGSKFVIWLPVNKEGFKDDEIEFGAMNSKQNEKQVIHEMLPYAENEYDTNKNLPVMLIIEDSADVRQYLRLNFKAMFNIIEARDGEQGLKMAIETIPDIIISDVMMPLMDGFQLCSKLKRNERTKHIPIILLTARIEESFQLQGIEEAGADDYITKPFSMDILAAKIKNCLGYRESLRKKFQFEFKVKPTEVKIQSADDLFIQRLIEVVEANLADIDFDVAKLSREFGISQTNLYRKLHGLLEIAPAQFIKDIRLKRAAQLLKANRYSIVEVAYNVGFSDPKYFSKSFKKKFGVLPSEYSNIQENEIELADEVEQHHRNPSTLG